jgi:hypothetical protein
MSREMSTARNIGMARPSNMIAADLPGARRGNANATGREEYAVDTASFSFTAYTSVTLARPLNSMALPQPSRTVPFA